MLYIIIAIIMFGVLIAVHEFGHFSAAKLLGVKVNEFAIGMGPRVLHRQKGETEYTLRLFPVGGFCAMEGEDEGSDDPRAFNRQRGWKKFIILIAGSFMNFLVGFLLVLLLFAQSGAFTLPVVESFMEGFPLEGAQYLLPGDRIVRVNGERIYTASDINMFFSRGEGAPMDLVIERNGARLVRSALPLEKRDYVSDGEQGQWFGFRFLTVEASPLLILRESFYNTIDFVRMVRLSIQDLFGGRAGLGDMSGPIGIVGMISAEGSETAKNLGLAAALRGIAYFIAFIAVNLAVMNMLPIPALDGGRIFLMAVSGFFTLVTRKRLDPKYEGYVHTAGFVCLIALMVVIAFNDIVRLIQG